MRTDKIRKYLIPNIPYLFILWAFLKLGTVSYTHLDVYKRQHQAFPLAPFRRFPIFPKEALELRCPRRRIGRL